MNSVLMFWIRLANARRDEDGFVTAEHLGVAALAILALSGIFIMIAGEDGQGGMAAQIVDYIEGLLNL